MSLNISKQLKISSKLNSWFHKSLFSYSIYLLLFQRSFSVNSISLHLLNKPNPGVIFIVTLYPTFNCQVLYISPPKYVYSQADSLYLQEPPWSKLPASFIYIILQSSL
jgi:hypothetical protein